ncbi:hypothetical protein JCM14076_00160 [Methylosoma difficile]
MMRNKRCFLWVCLVVVSSGLLGFKKPVDTTSKASVAKPQDNKVDKRKSNNDVQRLLDLSLPDTPQAFADPTPDQQDPLAGPEDNLFAKPAKKPASPLQLKGGWLMSQEPEAEKRKSVDGAGISINLKP